MVKERIDNQRLFDFSLSERYIYICIGDANEGEDCLPEIGIGEQRFENVIETKCTTEEGASIESEETIFVRGKKRRIGKNG